MKGCLLIHGFTGSPEEILPLATHLSKQSDWIVHTPVLAGHGEEGSLKSATWQDWIASAETELKKMADKCDDLYVVGFSMGGLIAAYLASKYPIKKLVLLSASVYYLNTYLLLREFSDLIKDYFQDQDSLLSSIQRYKRKVKNTPLKAVMNFKKLVKELTPVIDQITVPVLIIQGEKDNLVEPHSAHYIYGKVQSTDKEILLLKESKHRVCHDCEAHQIFNKVDEFLGEYMLH